MCLEQKLIALQSIQVEVFAVCRRQPVIRDNINYIQFNLHEYYEDSLPVV